MFIGLVVVLIGVALLLDQLDILEGGIWQYWPVLLIALGLSMIADWWKKRA